MFSVRTSYLEEPLGEEELSIHLTPMFILFSSKHTDPVPEVSQMRAVYFSLRLWQYRSGFVQDIQGHKEILSLTWLFC